MSQLPHRHSLALLGLIAALALLPTHVAPAQDAMDAKTAGFLRDRYVADMDTVHAKIMALAGAIPADKYSWRPAPGVRSVSSPHFSCSWFSL